MKKTLSFTVWLFIVFQSYGQIKQPDAFYRFDETRGNIITDHSGNNHHAWWYNYDGKNPGETIRTGWRPTEGIRNGAGYFNGDHFYCENPCSSGSDLVIFKTSELHACDNEIDAHNIIFKQDLNRFTIAFWFRNNWNYLCESGASPHRCYEDNSGCAWERQVLLSKGGGETGLILETFAGTTFPALIRLTIAGGNKEQRVVINAHHSPLYENKWVHYAIVFEGNPDNNTGKVRLYLDFNLVHNGERDTPFSTIPGHASSVVFGAQTGSSVTDFNIGGECWPEIRELCGITAEQIGRLRYGWLARGWVDDFAFWSDQSLTKQELIDFDQSIALADDTSIYKQIQRSFQILPSLTSDKFKIVGLDDGHYNAIIYNYLGQELIKYYSVSSGQDLWIPSSAKPGLYLVVIEKSGAISGAQRLMITKP
jgi:hypothetical protein